MFAFLLLTAFVICESRALADEFLQANDVVALVGGEEMVNAAEYGELEFAIARGAPALHCAFRSLAWEGDTVYSQRRDLNYPSLADQLAKIKATVVIAQFGQMEALDGAAKLPAFTAAYDKLLTTLAGDSNRRLLLIIPHVFTQPEDSSLPDLTARNDDIEAYANAIRALAKRRGIPVAEWTFTSASAVTALTRDGIHLNQWGETLRALGLANKLVPGAVNALAPSRKTSSEEALTQLIREKNRLWFNYYRPQNWAFLVGDRTNQPSSRDYRDPSKRWFPAEMEEYIGLVEAKDREIWQSAEAINSEPRNLKVGDQF